MSRVRESARGEGTRWRTDLPLVAAAGFAVRLVYAWAAPSLDPFLAGNRLHGDAASYDAIVQSLLAGSGYSLHPPDPDYFWPPLYPLLMWSVYSLGGYDLAVGRLVQAALGAAVPAVVYLLGRRIACERTALLAGLGAVFYPHLIYFGAWLIAEPLYLVLLVLTLLAGSSLQRRSGIRWSAALGILLGLGILAKPSSLFLLPAVLLWFLVISSATLKRRIALGTAAAVVMVVVVSPWLLRNHSSTGEWFLSTNGGYTFYGANNAEAFGGHREGFPPRLPGLSAPQQDREYYRLGLKWIGSDPGGFLRLAVRKYERLLSPLSVASYERDYELPFSGLVRAAYWAFLATAAAGMVLSARRWRECAILYLPVFGVLLSTGLFYGDARYTLPMVPSQVLFASTAIVGAFDGARRVRNRAGARAVARGVSSLGVREP